MVTVTTANPTITRTDKRSGVRRPLDPLVPFSVGLVLFSVPFSVGLVLFSVPFSVGLVLFSVPFSVGLSKVSKMAYSVSKRGHRSRIKVLFRIDLIIKNAHNYRWMFEGMGSVF